MKYNINLLPKKETGFVDKLVYFFLNYLRYIFVITQLITLGVFFYRFKIDQEIVDLKESVDQKQEIVQVVSPLIQEAQKIDKRTKEIKTVLAKQKETEQIMAYILSIFPEKLYLSELLMEKGTLKLSGTALDLTQLQSFYFLLQKEGRFDGVDLSSLKKTDEGYKFVLSLVKFKTI